MNTDTTMTSKNRKLEPYDLEIYDFSGKFSLNTKLYKVEENTLLSLPNTKYKEIIERHQH